MKIILAAFKFFLSFLLLFSFYSFSEKPAYLIYNKKGDAVSYKKMLDVLKEADIVLFGEIHNDAIAHWLELSLLKDLSKLKKEKIVVGAEMFEADDQLKLDELLSGKMNMESFKKEAKLWSNFDTDYKPLLEFSLSNKIPFIATNIPRRYASMVVRKGFECLDSLSEVEKSYIAPLPIETDLNLPGYKALQNSDLHGSQLKFLPEAQAIKDVTMTHFILKNFQKEKLFIHFNGSYHSQNFEGIYWHLKKKNPELKIVTISVVEQDTIEKLQGENKGQADFIICVPSDMTKTY